MVKPLLQVLGHLISLAFLTSMCNRITNNCHYYPCCCINNHMRCTGCSSLHELDRACCSCPTHFMTRQTVALPLFLFVVVSIIYMHIFVVAAIWHFRQHRPPAYVFLL